MWKFKVLLAIGLLLSACAPVSRAQSFDKRHDPVLANLWMDMNIEPQLIDWFNSNARPNDVARVEHFSLVDLLDRVKVGRKLVIFKNAADAEQLVPHLADRMDIIGYNLEHGPANRPDEQADPVGSVRRMRALADKYGLKLALGQNRAFALSDGVAMAPYVDMFVLQVQKVQDQPATVRDFVLPLVKQIRQANPNVEISVQVRTEGDMVAVADLIASMENSLNGISILTSPETTGIAQQLVTELRPAATEVPTPSPILPVTAALHSGALLTATSTLRRTVVATPAVTPVPSAPQPPAGPSWLLLAGLAAMGVVLAGLAATVLIYSYHNLRTR